jgi:hypothetical protein
MIDVSRGSFAAGFTIVLVVAGSIATLAALLTVILVSAAETAPARRPHMESSHLPGTGISGRMKPMPRKAATSTTARRNRSSASRAMLRRLTGRRSRLRRSIRDSVRIARGLDNVGETLDAAVDIHLDR